MRHRLAVQTRQLRWLLMLLPLVVMQMLRPHLQYQMRPTPRQLQLLVAPLLKRQLLALQLQPVMRRLHTGAAAAPVARLVWLLGPPCPCRCPTR